MMLALILIKLEWDGFGIGKEAIAFLTIYYISCSENSVKISSTASLKVDM